MRPAHIPCLLLALAISAVAAVAGGIAFESERVSVKVTPDQDVIEVPFKYTNGGEGEAKILSVISGCQCLEARAPEGGIAAGDKGALIGVFKIGAFKGVVEKHMVARVQDDDGVRDVPLTVAVEVPEVIRIEPGTLRWDVGQEPVEQSFLVTAVWPENFQIQKMESSVPSFGFRVETLEEGKRYRIHVKPENTQVPALALLQIHTDSRFEKFRNPMAFLSISRKP